MGNVFDVLVKTFEAKSVSATCDVTHYSLVLGDRDGVTGWREKTWNETTIKMIIILKGGSPSKLVPGTFVKYDAVGLTDTAVEEGDEIKLSTGEYYEVKSVYPILNVTPDRIDHYRCDLTELPLHEA